MSNKIDLKDPILNEHIGLHLQFIQNTITRMNTNSFQIKVVAGTIIGAFIAFMFDKGKEFEPYASIALLVLIGLFWCLDAYFLSLERKFRDLYKKITNKIRIDDMYMKDLYDMTLKEVTIGDIASAAESISLKCFYGAFLFLLIVAFILKMEKYIYFLVLLVLVCSILFIQFGDWFIKLKEQ